MGVDFSDKTFADQKGNLKKGPGPKVAKNESDGAAIKVINKNKIKV